MRHSWEDTTVRIPEKVLGIVYHETTLPVRRCTKCGMLKKKVVTKGGYEGTWWTSPREERWWFNRCIPLCVPVKELTA